MAETKRRLETPYGREIVEFWRSQHNYGFIPATAPALDDERRRVDEREQN